MKINEFIKKVNKVFYAEYSYDNNTIYVYKTEQDMCDENKYDDGTYYFMSVKVGDKKFSLFFDPDWMPEDVKGLSLLFSLLRELEDTPVKDRFPEKKYRLRWLDDKDGTPEYIDFDSNAGWNMWGDKNATDTFTESQLDQLKRDHPLFASVIDIMKEPVEEED
jgi:hypothetical protein